MNRKLLTRCAHLLNLPWPHASLKQQRLAVWSVLGALMVALIVVLAQPTLAAIQLSYFYVISNPTSVILQWGTASEFNVQGFEIQCKRADEPDTAYHKIDFRPAKGGPSTPAQYSVAVTSGITPGEAYCFRLLELTTDGTPGEAQDRCGYGPNVTPTPGAPGFQPTLDPNAAPAVATDAFGNPIVPAPALDAFGSPLPQPQATDAFGNPIPQPQATDVFGNPIPQPQATDVFGNPIPQPQATDAFGNPIPQPQATDAFGSPLPQPQATDVFGNPIPQGSAIDAFGNPVIPTVAVDAFGNPINPSEGTDPFTSPVATPTPDPNAVPTPIIVTPLPGDTAAQAAPQVPAEVAAAEAPAVAYIVVTAAPTEPPVALAAAMTPLPTVTPAPPTYQLVNALAPTTQNVMIMLLCLTFTGATGIGLLGLITSVMFMRSRSSQREFYDRYSLPPTRRRQW